jgi:predicted lipoprotein with Yx(FWY)xxD motif
MFKLRSLLLLLCLALVALPTLAQNAPPTVSLGSSDALGDVLVGPDGMTLYMFSRDTLDLSNCYEACAERWPPLLVRNADSLSAGEGLPGELGTIERTTGTLQVTYNGIPLYYWFQDLAQGDTKGNSVGGVWWVVPPATVYISRDDELGSILVGPTGKTLYLFTNDEPGVSNCADDCATNWPPLTVDSADAVVPGVHLPGELSTIERADGTVQVTYNGWPLYYWKDDAARGDTTGEGRGDVWYTIVPETVTLDSSTELGDYLVAANGKTLYTFANDEAGVSNCADDCAQNWPPLTVAPNDRLAAGAGIEGELGTIERADGSVQVTYNGMPLYFFAEDQAPGDTTGQGVGDVWAVAAP